MTEQRPDQLPVRKGDFLKVASLLNGASRIEAGRAKRNGMPRFLAETDKIFTAWEVSKKSVILTTMYRKK